MMCTGFVLAGGGSTRMGRDKALLPYAGKTLLEHVANMLREAAGTVTVVGDPHRYRALGYPVLADLAPANGPIGGVYTALQASATNWNLIVACDMPGLTARVFGRLLERLGVTAGNCVAAAGPNGEPEPLCAAYHRSCLPALDRAIRDKRLKMKDLLLELETEAVPVDAASLANVNTPAEWIEFDERSR